MTAKIEWGLRGVIVPLITPFKDDLSVDFAGVSKLVDYYIEEVRCDGLVPCGTTGESATLSHQEHAEVIEAVVKQARGSRSGHRFRRDRTPPRRLWSSPGSPRNSVPTPLCRCARTTTSPPRRVSSTISPPSPTASDLPLIVYNIPGRTGRNIEPKTIVRMWDGLPNVVGAEGLLVRHPPDHGDLPGHRPGDVQDLLGRGHHDAESARAWSGGGDRRGGSRGRA